MGIAVVVASLTLTAAQSPPPAIAELAPQAVEQIKDAPTEQTSDVGSANGGAGDSDTADSTTTTAPDGPGASTTTTEPPIVRPRVRRCVGKAGEAPRQIEDPQSPPCVPYWDGDNGGATYKGVTKDTVTVVVPQQGGNVEEKLEPFFNKRFEFYGRTVKFVRTLTGGSCEQMKADIERIDTELNAFAIISMGKTEWCFQREVARRGLVGLTADSALTGEEHQQLHPHVWGYPTGNEQLLTAMGQWACARLAGKPARLADGVDRTGAPRSSKKRTFGVIIQPGTAGTANNYDVDIEPLRRELSRCGDDVAEVFKYPDNDFGAGPSSSAVIQMDQAGVNSVFCLCGGFNNQYLPSTASAQQFYPEWIVSSYGQTDMNFYVKTFWADAQVRSNMIGITAQPRQWNFEDAPLVWALREANPSFNYQSENPTSMATQWTRMYRLMLLVSSGIQLAGPDLNPRTFAAGLQNAKFPNPPSPLQAGRVGFANAHTMTKDFGEFWWSESAPSPTGDGAGTWCYIDGGARRVLGRWPEGDGPLMNGPCDSGTQRAGV